MPGTFLKWAGGKKWLLKFLPEIMGNFQISNYYEPFLGGGAVFFSLQPANEVYLTDLNEELVNTYINVRDFPQQVLDILKTYQNTKEYYYFVRAQQHITNNVERAARFIYLNKTSYNGIYRVNRKGEYNVPYGKGQGNFYEPQKILDASVCLENANIAQGDFTLFKDKIKRGDLIFLDPPYTVSHDSVENGFIEYNQKLFSLNDQIRLSKYVEFIREKEAYYILTNAMHPTIMELFGKYDRVFERERFSLIGGNNAERGKVTEYIFTNIGG